MNTKILFLVKLHSTANAHVLTYTYDREGAKSSAHGWLGGNSDKYVVTPLTSAGDRIHLDITLAV